MGVGMYIYEEKFNALLLLGVCRPTIPRVVLE